MRTRTLSSLAVTLAVAGAMAAPAMALANTASVTPVSGTLVSVIAATSTAPAEIVLNTAPGTNLTFALTGTTAFSLALPGLTTATALPLSALAAGQTVTVTPSGVLTSGLPTASAVVADAVARMGVVSAVATTGAGTSAFDLANGTTTTLYSETGATQTIPTAALAPGQDALVYSLPTASANTAYVVYTANYPTLTGTLSTSGSVLDLATGAGTVALNEASGMTVAVGNAAATPAFLVNGAQGSVTYTVDASGGEAHAVDVQSSTVSGTVQQVTAANGATDLLVATASGNVTVAVLAATGLGGQNLSDYAPGAALTATGVLSGSTLTALDLTLTAPAPGSTGQTAVATGTVASVGAGQAVVTTANGPLVIALGSATAYTVGAYPAQAAALQPGESVAVTYLTVSSGSTPTAESVKIAAQTLQGQVSAMTSNQAFTLAVAGGGSVSVALAPGAVLSGASAIAAGQTVTVAGVEPPGQAFSAYAVWVGSTGPAPTPPPAGQVVRGQIAALNGNLLTVSDQRLGHSVAVVLTGQTRYILGGRTTGEALLAPGERVAIRTAADPSAPNQVDAVAVFLMPASVVGTVQQVSTSGADTILTVQGRRAPWTRMRHGRDGWDHRMGALPEERGRAVQTFTIVLTAATQTGSVTAQPQVGQRISAVGAWSTQGLMAVDAVLQAAPTPPPARKGHDGGQGRGHHQQQTRSRHHNKGDR